MHINIFKNSLTLIEVLVSAGILVICLVVAMSIFTGSYYLSDHYRDRSLAINALQSKLEELRQNPLNLSTGELNFNLTTYGFPNQESIAKLIVNNTNYTNLKKVTLLACFISRGKLIGNSIENCTSSSIKLETLIITNLTQ